MSLIRKLILSAVSLFAFSAFAYAGDLTYATKVTVSMKFNGIPNTKLPGSAVMNVSAEPMGGLPMPNHTCDKTAVNFNDSALCTVTPPATSRTFGYPIILSFSIPYINSKKESCVQVYKVEMIVVNPSSNTRTLNCTFDTLLNSATCDDPFTGTIGVNTSGVCQ